MADDFDPATVAWVLDDATLPHLLEAVAKCHEVHVDFETTGLNEHATRDTPGWNYPARVVLASFTLPDENSSVESPPTTWVLPLSHPDSPWLGSWAAVLTQVMLAIQLNDKPVINQNMKFDARWEFAHTGVDLSHQIAWDSMVGSHLLDETSSTKLKVRAPKVFDVPPWDDFPLDTPGAAERVPLFDLGLYAARDTYWEWRLARYQRQEMNLTDPQEPETADEVELARLGRLATWCAMPMVATLTAVEQRGMKLDVEWVRSELTTYQRSARVLGEELSLRYPGLNPLDRSFAPTSTWFQAWAEAAVDAHDLAVTAFTPGGKPQWSKGVLLRQARAGSQVAQDLIDLRSASKKAEYLSSWLKYVTPAGYIHTTYNAGRVITGRLSSDSPNIQQVTAVLKPAFIPDEGFVRIDFDYSQIELRIAAFISRCAPMILAFQQGRDLHTMLALKILQLGEEHDARSQKRAQRGLTEEDVTPTHRQAGKSANFGLLYMMGPYGFQQYAETVYGISFTPEEAQLIHRAFYEMWDGISDWHARAIARAEATGQVVSPIGRVRRLPDIHDSNDYRASYAQRAAVNAPVQGFASDIMQIAAASIEGTLPGVSPVRGAYLVGTVHDSIIVDARRNEWERVARECIDRMLHVNDILKRMDCQLDVPLAVEAKCGTRWGLSDVGTVHG